MGCQLPPAVTQSGSYSDLVSAEHERFERKHQSLKPKNQCVYEPERIHGVKSHTLHGTCLL